MRLKIKIPNITNLATTTALTAVENKLPDHSKHVATPEFNRLTAEDFDARLALANLASKNDNANFVKNTDFDDKLKKTDKKLLQIKQTMYLLKTN